MPGTIPAARQHLIDDIAKLARKTRGAPLPLPAFVQAYYRGVGEEDLQAARFRQRSRHRPPDTSGSAQCVAAGEPKVRVFNPELATRRLGIAAHDRRGRDRRHAVPGRLAGRRARQLPPADPVDDPPGAAHRPRPSWQVAEHGRTRKRARHHGVLAARGGAANRRSGAARSIAPEHPAHAGRRAACGFRLAGHPPAGARHRQGSECRRAGHSAPRRKGSRRVPRMARRQPLHVPRLPRIQARAHPLDGSPGTGASLRPRPAAHGRRPSASRKPTVLDGRTAAQGARSRAADRDQGQLGLHRAPRDLPRLRRHQDVRQGRPRRRRATLHRLVHVEHLQHQSARDSPAAPQGAARGGPHRRVADEPRRQGADARARDVSARRTVPVDGAGARAHDTRHRQPVRTPARAPLRAPRSVPAVLLVPAVRAA